MIRLVGAELLKVRTTRLSWGMLALTLGYTALNLGFIIAFAGNAESGLPPVSEPTTVKLLYGMGSGSVIFVLIVGILGIGSEYRHQTITQAFLATPKRGWVISGKVVTYAALGALFGVAVNLLTVAIVAPALTLKDAPAALTDHGVPGILGGMVLGYALYALIGLGLGALIRNQVAAIVAAIIWVLLAESVTSAVLPEAGKWLPGGALRSLTQTGGSFGGVDMPALPVWGGTLLLLGYGLAFVVAASLTTIRRDIT